MEGKSQLKNFNQVMWFCRVAFFVNYFWFGALKFFPDLSPAEDLATQTISELTFQTLSSEVSLYLLASIEVLIGITFLFNKLLIIAVYLMIAHMILTFSTFIFLPQEMFQSQYYSLTLAGQYVIKNLVFLSCGFLMLRLKTRHS